jgi:hypothetical protein
MAEMPNRIDEILGELNPGEARALLAALGDPEDSGRRIADVLTRHGYSVSKTTVNEARKVLTPTIEAA